MKKKETKIKIFSNQTIGELKEYYGMKNIVFKYEGMILSDDKSLDYYDIEDGDTIISTIRVIGGGGINMADISNEKGLTKGK